MSSLKTHKIYRAAIMVAVGGLSNGYDFYGPFDQPEEAVDWIVKNVEKPSDCTTFVLKDVRPLAGD